MHGEYKSMFWIFIGINIITFVLPLLSVWILIKVTPLAIAHPKAAKYTLITIFIILMVAGGLKIRDINYKKSPYYFWNELMQKNPKPINVSQQEFEAKNRAGYCWRDQKYYSKEELWYKAMKSLTGRIIYENELYWHNETLDMDGKKEFTSDDCKNSNSCRVWRIPINLTNQELKNFIGSGERYRNKVDYLTKIQQSEVYIFATDQNFIEANFTSKNFILIKRTSGSVIYGTDCCTLLTKSEWSLLKDNYKLFYAQTNEGTFVKEARIPANTNLNEWGVGNYYLTVNGFNPLSFEENSFYEFNRVFILNNCGDVLYKPFYYLDPYYYY